MITLVHKISLLISVIDVVLFVFAGHAEVVELLLSRFEGIEVDARNKMGITPLIKACVTGKRRCVQLLLDKGGAAFNS